MKVFESLVLIAILTIALLSAINFFSGGFLK